MEEKIYKVENNTLVFPRLMDYDKMEVDNVYNLSLGVSSGFYKDEHQVYYDERHSAEETTIIVSADGTQPFAVSTKDCANDDLPENVIARVRLATGQYIIRSITNAEDRMKPEIYIFMVNELLPVIDCQTEEHSINVKLVQKINRLPVWDLPDKLENAIHHVLSIRCIEFSPYLVPRYSFNPRRIIMTRLFVPGEDGRLTSVLDDGTSLILNKRSVIMYNNPEDPESGIRNGIVVRCFFGRRALGEKTIYVDGAEVPVLQRDDMEDYIEESDVKIDVATNAIKKCTTRSGFTFHAWLTDMNDKGSDVRLIYRTINGYAKFDLNMFEKKQISAYTYLIFTMQEDADPMYTE